MRGWRPLLIILAIAAVALSCPTAAVAEQSEGLQILIDYSHGQGSVDVRTDALLVDDLQDSGFEVVRILEGLNATQLSKASVLIMGPVQWSINGLTAEEIEAVAEWFSSGNKLIWIGCDSDYISDTTGQWVNDNMTALLRAVGSHVYPEPTQVIDSESHLGQEHIVVANSTSQAPMIQKAVEGVDGILMHGGTLLYGSTSSYTINPIPLENYALPNVHPLLFYSPAAIIYDYDDTLLPFAHRDGQEGQFVACTIETKESSVIVVSGASPYGSSSSMSSNEYSSTQLDGLRFVSQTINHGVDLAASRPVFRTTNLLDQLSSIYPMLLASIIVPLIYLIRRDNTRTSYHS
ncbi:MAG: hypothetical protein ACXADC_11105 [Candidatus Thorarchaeota archaeon]|jgi:hypothetical protein